MSSEPITIVLISGFMLDETLWDDLLPSFPKNWNIRATVIPKSNTIAEIAKNLIQTLPDTFVVVGFSLGGYIARAVAEQFPERISALILIATSLRPDSDASKARKLHAIDVMKKEGFKGVKKSAIQRTLHPHNQHNAEFIDKIHQMSIHLGFSAFLQQALLERPLLDNSSIQCPTLVIAGLQDTIRTVEESIELVNYIPNAHLEIIQETGHMIPMEQPTLLASVILKWLKHSIRL